MKVTPSMQYLVLSRALGTIIDETKSKEDRRIEAADMLENFTHTGVETVIVYGAKAYLRDFTIKDHDRALKMAASVLLAIRK